MRKPAFEPIDLPPTEAPAAVMHLADEKLDVSEIEVIEHPKRMTPEERKKVRALTRNYDFFVLPLIMFVYLFAYIDR